jgi:WD40 repeat protein
MYVNSIQLADAKYREGNIRRVRELLASCPNDLRGWEWDYLSHTLDKSVTSIATGQDGVISFALSPDGKRVVSGGWDRTIKIWDLADGIELVTINLGDRNAYLDALYHGDVEGLRQARLSLAWSVAFSLDGKQIASGHASGEIKIWDVATGKQLKTLEGHRDEVDSIAFSPDGKLMATVASEVKLWDTTNWTELMSLSDPETGMESCVTFSQDGKRIASAGGWDGQIKVWDTLTGQRIWSIRGYYYWAYSVSFSPDGKLLASGGDNHVKLWDATTGSNVMTLRGHDATVYSVSFSPDGKYVASGGYDNMIRIWDIATGETVIILRGHEHIVEGVLFAPDGKHLVSRSWDGTIKIWDMSAPREPTKLVGHSDIINSFAFSPDGKRIVSGDGVSIKLWDVESATELKTLCRDNGWVSSSVVFSPDGRRIALREYSGTCRIWDAATGDLMMVFHGPKPYVKPTGGMAFSPDGRLMAFSGGVDKTVKVWDVIKGEEVATLKGHSSLVCSVAFSPDGRFVVAGGSDPNIKVWEWAARCEPMTLRGHDKGIIGCVAFSPDGKRIVSSGQEDQMVKVWDATTGTELMTLKHADSAISAVFSPDGRRIISGSHDRTVRVWDAETGAELLTLRAGFSVLDVSFSPDGKTIAGSLFDHTITLWESVPPPRGSNKRKDGEAARKIVDELQQRHGWYREVISQLLQDATLGPAVRKLAIQIANSRKWEDTEKIENELNNEVWRIIVAPDKDVKAYQAALEKAVKANTLESNDPAILTTLGAGQYRLGSYEDALKTLTKVERILSDIGQDPDPWNLVFKVMTLHKLDRLEEAKDALEKLQELCKDRPLAEDMVIQNLLAEAEKLISDDEK